MEHKVYFFFFFKPSHKLAHLQDESKLELRAHKHICIRYYKSHTHKRAKALEYKSRHRNATSISCLPLSCTVLVSKDLPSTTHDVTTRNTQSHQVFRPTKPLGSVLRDSHALIEYPEPGASLQPQDTPENDATQRIHVKLQTKKSIKKMSYWLHLLILIFCEHK